MVRPMKNGSVITRFSYADDIEILGFGQTVEELAAVVEREIDSFTK